MSLEQSAFYDFVDSSVELEDINQLFDNMVVTMRAMGLDNVFFSYLPNVISRQLDKLSPVFKVSDAFNQDFLTQYTEENLAVDDFAICRCKNGYMEPMNWWELKNEGQLNKQQESVLDVTRSFGIIHGLTIPTYFRDGSMAGVTLTYESKGASFFTLCDERMTYIRKTAIHFTQRVLYDEFSLN